MMKMTACAFAFCGAVVSASAGSTFTWTNAKGNGDWTDPGNFAVGSAADGVVATVCPGADDEVHVPDGVTVTLGYDPADPVKTANCAAFSAVYRIIPGGEDTVFDITVPEGESFSLGCAVTAGGNSSGNHDVGHVVKRGKGDLCLDSLGKAVYNGDHYDYFCALTVEDGAVRLYGGDTTLAAEHYFIGKTTVNAPGTLFMAKTGTGLNTSTSIRYLYGDGVLTNDFTSAGRLRIHSSGDFSGKITGGIYYFSPGSVKLTGTDSTFRSGDNLNFVITDNRGKGVTDADWSGNVGVMKFGKKAVDGVGSPSSIGMSETILVRDNGAAIRYLGTGETTDKDLRIWSQTTSYPTYLDGGAHGGLAWTGLWGHRDTSVSTYSHYMQRLVIQGSNTEECVMSGVIEAKMTPNSDPPVMNTFCITKAGSGTWRIAHNDESNMLGTWRILEGTLRFDTIGETNVNSALGKSTALYKDLGGVAPLEENRVDHAFWLGGGESAPRANLEYVGETNCVSTTRRFAVNGTGALLNNGTGLLRISGFYATNAPSTLVLGGSNASDNVADGIRDGGDAVMSVVKEGGGTWRIGCESPFSGSLDVKGGRLEIGNPGSYAYYRWVIRATYTTGTTSGSLRTVGLRSFGLFDASGNDRAYGLTDEGEWTLSNTGGNYSGELTCYRGNAYSFDASPFWTDLDLKEGHFRITRYDGSAKTYTTGGCNEKMAELFKHTEFNPKFWSRTPQEPPILGDDDTWTTITMRPVKGSPITGWDYVNHYYDKSYQMISNCVLEASMDGRTWTRLDEVTNDVMPTKGTWQSDGSSVYAAGYEVHASGMPIPAGPSDEVAFNASSVSVAAGAELVARAPAAPVIRKLVVDGTAGGGRIEGFAFAADAALEIVNAPEGNRFSVPVEVVDATGTGDVSGWTLTVDGAAKPNLRFRVSSDGVDVWGVGTQVVIR